MGVHLNKSHKDHLRALAEWEADLAWIQDSKNYGYKRLLDGRIYIQSIYGPKEDELKLGPTI